MVNDVVIMAAGRGSRLSPLTDDKPKCMVEINGKPIIQHIYDNIRKVIECPNIFIIVGYKKEVVINYSMENKLACRFVEQKEMKGTADAIYQVKGYVDDSFVVLSGDIIYDPKDIEYLSKHPNWLLCTSMSKRLYEYGTIDFDVTPDGVTRKIRFINEKSTRPTSRSVNCGAYYFTKEVFDYIDKTSIDKRFGEKVITNTINMMIDDGIEFNGCYIKRLNEITRVEDIDKLENIL